MLSKISRENRKKKKSRLKIKLEKKLLSLKRKRVKENDINDKITTTCVHLLLHKEIYRSKNV